MKIASLEPLAPEDFAAAVDRLVLTRWFAAGLMMVLTLLCVHLLHIPLPAGPLLWLGLSLAAYNAVLALLDAWLQRASSLRAEERVKWFRRLVEVQVGLDWIAITAFVHYTGGVTSPGIPLFLIHMLMVTALLQQPSPYIYPALATASLCALAALENTGALAHHDVLPFPAGFHQDLRLVSAPIVFFAIAAFASVHMTQLVVARLRERDRQVSALLLASQAASSSLELDEVLDHLVESAARALSCKAASIRLFTETGDREEMVASVGLSERYLNRGLVDIPQSQPEREALAGAPVIVTDVAHDPRILHPEEAAAEGIRSLLVIPVLGRRGPLGALRVYADVENAFAPEDVTFARSVAAQGAAAIENALAHEALHASEKSRGQFVRMVTHELRSPIAGTLSLARALLDGLVGDLQPEQRTMLTRMSARLTSLGELVNDLLVLAASQSPDLQEKPLHVDLLSALRWVVDRFSTESVEKGIAVLLRAPDAPVIVVATDQGLARIFENLLGNAVKYTPAGGRVEVHAEVEGSSVVVTVTDTGIGIPEQDLPRLFEDFFRASNAKRSEIKGTGLGLSIVKRLVTNYRGVVSVQSSDGKGTTFSVVLPLADAGAVEDSQSEDGASKKHS
jgi:signal transduction histidine kinase